MRVKGKRSLYLSASLHGLGRACAKAANTRESKLVCRLPRQIPIPLGAADSAEEERVLLLLLLRNSVLCSVPKLAGIFFPGLQAVSLLLEPEALHRIREFAEFWHETN